MAMHQHHASVLNQLYKDELSQYYEALLLAENAAAG